DAEEVAADPLHQRRALPLDRVGARLVHRLPRRDVRGDLIPRQRPERHVGDVDRMRESPVPCDRDRRHHLMGAPCELRQHLDRLGRRLRLLEDGPAQHDRRVGREHDRAALAPGHDARHLTGETSDVLLGQLRAPPRLVHVLSDDAELEPQHLEQLAPAGRPAGEDEAHFSRTRVTGPSFTSSTSIIAPNSPVSTRVPPPAPRPPPRSLRCTTNLPPSALATPGAPASTQLATPPAPAAPRPHPSADRGTRNAEQTGRLRGARPPTAVPRSVFRVPRSPHSTVTLFARFRGWSTLHPRRTAM